MEDGITISMGCRELSFIMQRKNFMKDNDGWRRGFIFVTAENNQLKIAHEINSKIGILTNIEFNDLDDWIKYFDRI